jgi:hypothetical protein
VNTTTNKKETKMTIIQELNNRAKLFLNNSAVNITVETSFSKEKIYGVTPQALVDFAHEQISVMLREIYKL